MNDAKPTCEWNESKPYQQSEGELTQLVSELLDMLETIEESDSGRSFHPTTIQTCRCMDAAKLEKIMPKITAIVRKKTNVSGLGFN